MNSTTMEGTVTKIKGGKARVTFSNGDKRWFEIAGDEDRFVVGAKIKTRATPLPQDRETLFDYLQETYPSIRVFHACWSEGDALVSGMKVRIADTVDVFGTGDSEHFHISKSENKVGGWTYKYHDIHHMEDALSLINEMIAEAMAHASAVV